MSEEQLLETPSVFGETGNFLLERELGRGGMGGVYLGRDKMLDRPVAVKVMLKTYGSDAEFVEKFKREAQAAARLIHPNIAQVYSYGIADGMPYISMELVAGGSLWALMKNAPDKQVDIVRVMKIGEQVAQALRCAADQGLVHGDVKPENILLDANGNAKLVDFGLAAMQKDTTEIWGTPYYIAPEKVRKEVADFRADMYSLGGTLYHALTGVAPFEGADPTEVVKARFLAPPKKPSEIRPGISAKIDALLMRMLALEKADRFPSFEALLAEFKQVMTSGLTAKASSDDGAKKGRPKLKLRRHGAAADDDSGTEEAAPSGKGRLKVRGARRGRMHIDNDDAGDSDSAGSKVLLVVVSVIGAIALVVGGLVWYVAADRKARAEAERAQIVRGVNKAREALADTRRAVEKFADEHEAFAEEAVRLCEKTTGELAEVLPEDVARLLKIEPTKELQDAIDSTNEVVTASAEEAADEEAEIPKAAARAGGKKATAKNKIIRVHEEYDPADPDAQKPVEAETKAEEETAPEEPAAEPVEEAKPTMNESQQRAVRDMNELWMRAYGCQAGAIRIRHAVRKLLAKIEAGEKLPGESEAEMSKLGQLSIELTEEASAIKTMKEAEVVQKGVGFIKSRGATVIERVKEDLRIAKLHADREEQKRLEAEAAAAAAAARAAAHQKKIEEEVAAAKERYEALVTAGTFRSLSFEQAIRQLKSLQDGDETAEGMIEAGKQLKKVEAMNLVLKTFVKNVKDYEFTKSKLKGAKVTEVTADSIKIVSKGGKPQRLLWTKIYADYHGNLNELINRYIVKGQENAHLNKKDWCTAMLGSALTMRVICADDVAAPVRDEQLAKKAIEVFPDYQKVAEDFFPDIDFNAVEKEDDL